MHKLVLTYREVYFTFPFYFLLLEILMKKFIQADPIDITLGVRIIHLVILK